MGSLIIVRRRRRREKGMSTPMRTVTLLTLWLLAKKRR